MKNLGGFGVALFEDGGDYRATVGIGFHDAPKSAIVGGVMTLILRLTEIDPEFPAMLEKVMEARLRGEVEVERVENGEWTD